MEKLEKWGRALGAWGGALGFSFIEGNLIEIGCLVVLKKASNTFENYTIGYAWIKEAKIIVIANPRHEGVAISIVIACSSKTLLFVLVPDRHLLFP